MGGIVRAGWEAGDALGKIDPGRENTLADCLSRLRGAIDDHDWRLLGDIFRALEAACGPFDVDACSDPLGRITSFCPAFWSAIDSRLAHV
eukprot:jgi/Tetstr1/420885/TSEL_011948.t1